MGLLDGKVALITGAGRGVGQGSALALAREGCAVVVTELEAWRYEETVAAIQGFGGKARGTVADATRPEDVKRSVAETVEWFGGLDILINNAVANNIHSLIDDLTDEAFQDQLDLGPMAVLRYMRAAHPHMKARGGGVIINLVSGAMIEHETATYGPYGACKAAIRVLTRAAACEWGVDNIRALNVAPIAESPGFAGWCEKDPEGAQKVLSKIPLGRPGRLEEDIGQGVMALCLPFNKFVTGCTVPVDGGTSFFA